jgi:ferredoxin
MDRSICAQRGRTLLSVAKENHVPVHFECDGNMTCGTCYVKIERGMENLSRATEEEREHLNRRDLTDAHRLSCQARLLGDVEVLVVS